MAIALVLLAAPHVLVAWILMRMVREALNDWPTVPSAVRAELFIARQPGGIEFLAARKRED